LYEKGLDKASASGRGGSISVVPTRTLVAMNFIKAVNEGAVSKPGPLVFFTLTMWSEAQEESMIRHPLWIYGKSIAFIDVCGGLFLQWIFVM
jgi:hypothetical protein